MELRPFRIYTAALCMLKALGATTIEMMGGGEGGFSPAHQLGGGWGENAMSCWICQEAFKVATDLLGFARDDMQVFKEHVICVRSLLKWLQTC
jgi:hypothetical protein